MPDKDTWYEVTLGLESLPAYKIRAAYVAVDERLFPGWTQLKAEGGTIVALVRSDPAVLIRRLDDDGFPAAARPAAVPSPAAVAAKMGITTAVAPPAGAMTLSSSPTSVNTGTLA